MSELRSGSRVLPALDASNSAFWTGGKDGKLRLGRCASCSRLAHPAMTVCVHCGGTIDGHADVDGRGVIVALTKNHQRWPHAPEPPYVIVIVALRADPDIRLTSNLSDEAVKNCRIGSPVRAVFETHEDVQLPIFEEDDSAAMPWETEPPATPNLCLASSERYEHRAAITGIGTSVVGRNLDRTPVSLTIEACRRALEDAGLTPDDVDGLVAYPGPSGLPGLSDGGARSVVRQLGLRPTWHHGGAETPGQTGALAAAMLAVSAGLCRHVLCFTGVSQSQRPAPLPLAGGRVSGEMQWQMPYGAVSPANWIALYASHYMARWRVRRETLGWLAISARRHAQRNRTALYREPLSMDDYLGARLVSTPFGLYDCDVPCDGAWAVVVSAVEPARDMPHKPIRIDAAGTALSEPQSWDQSTLTHQPNVFSAGAHLWQRSRFKPSDVDVALLYDGFTFNALCWLEALGFCAVGEAAAFVEGGERIGPGGSLPLNPHGGQLNCGRSNGFGHLIEAVLQLRGRAEGRQVPDARVAVSSSGGGIPAGCFLLHTTD